MIAIAMIAENFLFIFSSRDSHVLFSVGESFLRGQEAILLNLGGRERERNSLIEWESTWLRPADLDGWCGMFLVRHSDYDGCGSALESHQTSPERGTMKL
jgi:hypothetical protein